jgi:glycosyltransferase involved in cell wall biosynthesis
MPQSTKPLVSVGVPVFNEAHFLRESLEALVQQDYSNIEIIISDNASTDATGEICQEYVNKYPWVSYHRFDANTGATNNFIYVLKAASGKYFMWAAGHDLWSKNYVSSCVEILESHPKAVIACGSSKWIDDNGRPFDRESGWTDTRGMDVIARYFTIFWGNMHPILGLILREQLITAPMANMVGSDLNILTYLSLKGDIMNVANSSWSRREFRIEKTYNDKLKRYKNNLSIINKLFPLARLPIELIKAVINSNHPFCTRLLISFLLLPSFPVRYIAGRISNKRQSN